MAELEPDLGARQRVALHHLDRAAQLGLGALEELAARRDVEEERPHLDRGPAPARRRIDAADAAAFDAHPPTVALELRARELDAGDGGDRRQRLAAKPERRHPLEILEGRELRSGVAIEGEHDVVAPHPRSVVVDRDPALAAGVERDGDAARAGVERVLDQLLDHRSRSLDHFAGSDLAHQPIVEESDLRHAYSTVGSATSRASPANSPVSSRSRRCVASITW